MYDVILPVVLATGGATTTVPSWISGLEFDGLTATAEALAGVVAPVIVSVLAFVIGLKLLKKFANKIG